MILASFYIVDRLKQNATSGFTPIHTQIAWWTLVISIGGLLLLLIPAIRGLRFGTVFATTLAMLSMIPLTFLSISWISPLPPVGAHFSQLTASQGSPDGSRASSPATSATAEVHDLHRVSALPCFDLGT